MKKTPFGKSEKKPGPSKINQKAITSDSMYRLAFNAAQATFISIARTGKIIAGNKAACKMLGYIRIDLLTRHWSSVILSDTRLPKIIKHTNHEGHFMALVTIIRKDGQHLQGEITAAFFRDEKGNDKMITTIKDLSRNIEQQKQVDTKKEKIVDRNTSQALAKSNAKLEEEMKSKEAQIANATADAKEM
jgi:PAS domain S-box-containing protein